MKIFDFFKRKIVDNSMLVAKDISIKTSKHESLVNHINNDEIISPPTYTINSNQLPYYLDNNFKIDFDEIVHELGALYNGKNKIDEDYQYFKIKEELDKVKQLIFNNNNDSDNNNIELSKNGLELSIELCNYCIEMNYTSSMFVLSETKGYFDYFTEQLAHWKIFNPYNKACQLEKDGYFEQAMELYLDILRNNSPTGTSYYTSPLNLSINLFNYADVIEIYTHLKENYLKNNIENLKDIYESYSIKISELNSYENNYSNIKSRIINILENSPGTLQTTLYKEINIEHKESLRFLLYYLEKLNLIKREKSGRTYKLYLV